MFLNRLAPKFIARCKGVLEAMGDATLSLLQKDAYDLFYEYDSLNKVIYYSALIKEGREKEAYKVFAPLRLYFSIDENGVPSSEPNEYSAPLILHLYEAEKEMGEDELSSLYGDAYYEAELTKGLSPVEAAQKLSVRKDFENFINKVNRIKEDAPNEKVISEKCGVRLHLSVNLHFYYFGLDLITTSGTYHVDNLRRFVEAFKNRSQYKLSSKESITVDASSFRSPYDAAMPLLCNNAYFYDKRKTDKAEVYQNRFVPLLELLVGEDIDFDGKRTQIEIKDPVSVSLGKKGEPIFTPSIKNNNNLFLGENGVILVLPSEKSVHYYPYGSEVVKQTYDYFYNHKDQNFDYIKDIFVSKLLPKVSSSLKNVASKGSKSPFLIRLYIAFDSQERLTFKTIYEENGVETKANKVESEFGKSLMVAYEALLTSLGGVSNGHLSSQEAIYDFLTKDISALSKLAQIYFEDSLKGPSLTRVGNFNISVRYSQNYLDMTLDADEYDPEELSKIMIAVKKKKKFILLRKKTILLDDPNLAKAAEIFGDGKISKRDMPLYHLFSLQNAAFKVETDDRSKEVLRDIMNFRDAEVFLPTSLLDTLRPYQLDGVKYLTVLSKYGLGGILADEMGLGKTLQAIAYLVSLEEEGPILIVTPKAVLYNWLSEINRFSSLDATIIDGPKAKREEIIKSIDNKGKHVYLSAYDSFRRDSDSLALYHFSVVLLDEAQSVKNAFSQRHIALEKLSSSHRYALTGTPLENSPLDLWSIFDFLMPGYLGNFDDFGKFSGDETNRTALSALLKPFTLRRRKDDVLIDLPPKTETDILLSMEDSQRLYYVAFLQRVREQSMMDGESRIAMLAALTRLRQICVDPSSFIEEYDGISSKLSYCRDMLLEAKQNGHKVIVFSSFKSALTHLEEILGEEDLKIGVITGDTSGKDRLALAKEFNKMDGDIDVMLVSLKAGGVGLNLIGADMVIHLDPWWNPAAENQASDRAHRIGQTRPVTIFRLISKDSIEEKVQILQEKKKDLFEELVEGSGGAGKLTDEDILFLLS
ncbi:MAG: DEAD/DEAH box helicase [Bacilli bacterium]|nr:DEAD/DEAH box helicase [Bacilli bacterium]